MSYQIKNVLRLHARDSVFKTRAMRDRLLSGRRKNLILCNSYPKSGTHLLYQILYSLSNYQKWDDIVSVQALCGLMNTTDHIRWKIQSAPDGSIVRSHLMCCDEIIEILQSHNCKNFFIYRDLRDVAVSHARWVMKEPRIFLHDIYHQQANFDQQLMSSIQGTPLGTPFGSNLSHPNIGQDFERWKGWLSSPDTLAIKFEDLVGDRGGGSKETRLALIEKIAHVLEIDISPEQIEAKFSSAAMNPEESHTFRKGGKGSIGGWQSAFKEEHKDMFKAVAGQHLIDLGYESDFDW